jgi:hypothetical protein
MKSLRQDTGAAPLRPLWLGDGGVWEKVAGTDIELGLGANWMHPGTGSLGKTGLGSHQQGQKWRLESHSLREVQDRVYGSQENEESQLSGVVSSPSPGCLQLWETW